MTKPGVVVVTDSSGFIDAALISKFAGHFSLVSFDWRPTHRHQPQNGYAST